MTEAGRPLDRAERFRRRFALDAPVLLAPMAGACPTSLSIAIANAGGMGACGALLMKPDEIAEWAATFRAQAPGRPLQINVWIPGPPPRRDSAHEAELRAFLAKWGPPVPAEDGDAPLPDFAAQLESMLQAAPAVISSIMGLFPPDFVRRLKAAGIAWFAKATTVEEATQAEAAGADAIVAQGAEAGGHRGSFRAEDAEARLVGSFTLIPAIADAVRVPVIASGGIADARGVAAALLLGASAAEIGTAFLRCPEAKLPPAWADALARAKPEEIALTRAFTGRAARAVATKYVRAAAAVDAPRPAPYPVQRGLTSKMRADAVKANDIDRLQAWAGQSASIGRSLPAADLFREIADGVRRLLPS